MTIEVKNGYQRIKMVIEGPIELSEVQSMMEGHPSINESIKLLIQSSMRVHCAIGSINGPLGVYRI